MNGYVNIVVRERGKIVTRREGKNVWVDSGRTLLASLVSYTSFGPDTPERDDRIRRIGLGIGSIKQTNTAVDSSPLSTSYPVGADPNATNGKAYRTDFPLSPLISTLERPVRISGGSNPYATAPGTDVWRRDVKYVTHVTTTEVTFRDQYDTNVGDFVYSPFTVIPISEAGLYPGAAPAAGTPFATLAAYHAFDPINLIADYELEIAWNVKF